MSMEKHRRLVCHGAWEPVFLCGMGFVGYPSTYTLPRTIVLLSLDTLVAYRGLSLFPTYLFSMLALIAYGQQDPTVVGSLG